MLVNALEKSSPTIKNTYVWTQIYAIFSVSIGGFTAAASFTWTSPTIPILISNSSNIQNVTLEDVSYFSVIPPIATIVATPFISFLTDSIGRKRVIMLMALPHTLSWLFIIMANSLTFLYVSRIFSGIADSIFLITIPMYIGEIATPNVRGTWGNILTILLYLAQLLMNIIGFYYDIITTATIFISFPVLYCIFIAFTPESPYYLLMKNKSKEAASSLKLLRCNNNVEEELFNLTRDVERQTSESGSLKEVFTIPVNRKALLICVTLRASQHLSGIFAFNVYIQYIFFLSGSNMSAISCTIVYSSVFLVMTSIYSFVANKFGRRRMLIFSCIGCTIALVIESLYFYIMYELQTDLSNVNWIPLAGMVLYVVACTSGLGLLPNLMTAELFSANVKSKAIGVVNISISISLLLLPKLFQTLSTNVGMYLPFLLFGICTLLSTFFCYFYVPETKQKTLEEIQQMLMKGKVTVESN